MTIKKLQLIAIFFLSISCSYGQDKTPALPSFLQSVPGNIKLLSGYVHKRQQGIDTAVGKISKENGVEINYDIGRLAGNYAKGAYSREKQNVVWSKTQKVNDLELTVTYLKDASIYASFTETSANFISNVKTIEQLTDFLLMIMTYNSKDEPKDNKQTKP